jgi:hypothetical protein
MLDFVVFNNLKSENEERFLNVFVRDAKLGFFFDFELFAENEF